MNPRKRVEERAESLPKEVWNCERCETQGGMQIRRSSLNERFYADDLGLKCSNCRYYATHGIPFNDPEAFEAELEARETRVLDFAEEDGKPNTERLADLGYLAKSKRV